MPDPCPLCASGRTRAFAETGSGTYRRCRVCALVFQSTAERPDALAEWDAYCAHDNRPDDPDYRAFLARLADPLCERLMPGARGLDYGAGPEPVLAGMLEERGFPTAVYDPFFAPDESVLERRYDFIACTETAEHFHDPGREFDRLAGLLRLGGILGLMTKPYAEGMDFGGWWYHRDPTHVSFYSCRTFHWLTERYGWRVERPAEDIALFLVPRRPATLSVIR